MYVGWFKELWYNLYTIYFSQFNRRLKKELDTQRDNQLYKPTSKEPTTNCTEFESVSS